MNKKEAQEFSEYVKRFLDSLEDPETAERNKVYHLNLMVGELINQVYTLHAHIEKLESLIPEAKDAITVNGPGFDKKIQAHMNRLMFDGDDVKTVARHLPEGHYFVQVMLKNLNGFDQHLSQFPLVSAWEHDVIKQALGANHPLVKHISKQAWA